MRAETLVFTAPAPAREVSAPVLDQAAVLAASGSVCYRITRRVDTLQFTAWQRFWYQFLCRRLKGRLRVPPPIPAQDRGDFTDFWKAVARCRTANDQLHVLPLNWAYDADETQPDVVCRPCDKTDSARFERIKSLFGNLERKPETEIPATLVRHLQCVKAKLETL